MNVAEIARDYESAVRTVETDPAKGLPLARAVLRRSRRSWRCLRVRCGLLVGKAYARLGGFPEALRYVGAASRLAAGCRCCAPAVDRNRAAVLAWSGEYAEALRLADRALEANPRDILSLLVRAQVRWEARAQGAAEDYQRLEVGSERYRVAVFGWVATVGQSGQRDDRERARAHLPELRRSFHGVPETSVELALLDWLDGQLAGADRDFRRGRQRLRAAVRRFKALKMPHHHAAAWADLIALEMQADGAGRRGRGDWRERVLRQPNRARRRTPWPAGPFATVPGGDRSWEDAIRHREPVPVGALRRATGLGLSLVPYPDDSQVCAVPPRLAPQRG